MSVKTFENTDNLLMYNDAADMQMNLLFFQLFDQCINGINWYTTKDI